MTQQIDDGGPMFPIHDVTTRMAPGFTTLPAMETQHPGCSVRTWLAGMAMLGLLSTDKFGPELVKELSKTASIPEASFVIADSMLAQLHKDADK